MSSSSVDECSYQQYTQILAAYKVFKINNMLNEAIESLSFVFDLPIATKNLSKVHIARGILYYENDQLYKSINDFEKAVNIIGTNGIDKMYKEFNICCSYLIEIYYSLEWKDKAINVASNALSIFSTNTKCIYYYNTIVSVSRLLAKENNFEMAINHLYHAIENAKCESINSLYIDILNLEIIRVLLEQGDMKEIFKSTNFVMSASTCPTFFTNGSYAVMTFLKILTQLSCNQITIKRTKSYCHMIDDVIRLFENNSNLKTIDGCNYFIRYAHLIKIVIMRCCSEENTSIKMLNDYTEKYNLKRMITLLFEK